MVRITSIAFLCFLVSVSTIAAKEEVAWKEMKGKHFVVYYAGKEKFATEVLAKAEKLYGTITKRLGFTRYGDFWTWDQRAKIFIFSDQQSFSRRTGAPTWSIGYSDRDSYLFKSRAIVTYRSEHGPFANIFELGNVPNLGRKAFKQITGMAFTAKRRDRSDRLSKLLKLPVAELASLSSIARAVASRQGFAGCIISDNEGMPLADYRSGGTSEALSAVIPQLVKQVRDNMEIAGFPEIDCISVSAEGQMISMIGTGRVFLTYLHVSDKLTTGQLALVRKVAGELAWLLSHRGYVGD